MTAMQTLTSHWNWTSPALFVIAGILVVDNVVNGWRSNRHREMLFVAAMALMIAYVSPIGVLANGYLFSAHIIQHLLLLVVIPLCYLLSLPERQRIASQAGFGAFDSGNIPQLGWLCGMGAMWLWHVPSVCHAAGQSAFLGVIRDVSLLLAGFAFWWPVFSPFRSNRLSPLPAAFYLFSACVGCTLQGVYITFTPVSVCPIYAHPIDRLGVVPSLNELGLTPEIDQQLGGLLMWVPPCLIYGGAILSLLCAWYAPVNQSSRSSPIPVFGMSTHE